MLKRVTKSRKSVLEHGRFKFSISWHVCISTWHSTNMSRHHCDFGVTVVHMLLPTSLQWHCCPLSTSGWKHHSSVAYLNVTWLSINGTVSSIFCQVLSKFLSFFIPSVLWRCWLGGRKGIRPVKNWVVGCWHGYLSGAVCRFAYGPPDATATHCLLLQ